MQQPFAQRARTVSVRARMTSWALLFLASFLSLALPGLAVAAPSVHCPTPIAMTVSHSGSASVPGIGTCDGPADFGLGDIGTDPLHGTAIVVPGNQDVIYSHGGDSATSDTFTVNDGDGGEVTVNVTIQAPTSSIVISPGSLSMRVAQSFSQQFTASGGSGGYTWSGTNLPADLTLSASGLLSGTPKQRGPVTFSLTATDSSLATKTQSYTLTIADPLITLTPTSVQRVATRATSITFAPSGGIAPYAYPTPAPYSGTLPPGMALAGNVLSGTPTTVGTYNFVLEVADDSDGLGTYSARVPVQVEITAAPVIVVNPATLADGRAGIAYGQTVTATGGANPHALSWTGSPPPGLTLNAATGAVAGTPTQTGTFNFTVVGTDNDGFTGSRAYTVIVNAPTISLTPGTLPAATRGTAYSATVSAVGGNAPYSYSITGGALPSGMALNPSTGQLSGTPSTSGTFNFRVSARDSTAGGTYTGSMVYVLQVVDDVPVANPVSATVGYGSVANPIVLNIAGGTATSVAAATGPSHGTVTVSGTSLTYTPAAGYAGADSFTYTATNGMGTSAPATVAITVSTPTLDITPAGPVVAQAGQAFTQVFTFSGGMAPYTASVVGLPPGLSVTGTSADTVTVSGTPTQAGIALLTLTATDSSSGTGPFVVSRPVTLDVGAPVLAMSPSPGTLASAYGQPYSQAFTASGGNGTYTYALMGTLPIGLSFNSASGVLEGTPTQAGSFPISIRATDQTTGTGPYNLLQNYTLQVLPPTVVLSPATLPTPVIGVAYSQTFTAAGGIAPYAYSLSSGSLPVGMSLSSAGVLSGTPTYAGTHALTIVATDQNGMSASRTYTITIGVPVLTMAPTAGALPQATGGHPYSQTFIASGGLGPYTYSLVAGGLPPGVAFSSAGVLSGTPVLAGTYVFTVRATDSTGGTPSTLDQPYSLSVVTPAIAFTPTTVNAVLGTAFNATLAASGGRAPYTFSLVSGSLPAGVALSSAGVIAGTPLLAGTYPMTLRVRDTDGFTADRTLTIDVADAVPVAVNDSASTLTNQPVPINLTSNDTGVITSIAVAMGPSHGTLSISATTATYTPATGYFGTDTFTYTATGPGGSSAPATVTVTIIPVLSMMPTAGALPQATAGTPYTQAFTASGGLGPYAYSLTAGALPPGVAFSSAGVLGGTPTAAGTFNFTLRATQTTGGTPAVVDQPYSLTVIAPTLTFTPGMLDAVQGKAFSATLTASGGQGPYAFSVVSGAIPSGVAMSSAGVIAGTPTIAGSYPLTLRVRDANGFTADRTVTIVVGDAAPVAANDTASTPARRAVTIDVADNDSGAITGIAVQAAPANGTVSISGLAVTYTPTADFFGADSFTYVASGPGGTSAPATVTVTVLALPVPVAQNLGATVLAGQTVTIDATAGATGGPYHALAVATAPSVGTVVVSGTDLAFTPPADANGDITFTYTLANAFGTSAPATVTVTVNPMPMAPLHRVDAIAATAVQVELTDDATGGPFTAATLLAVTPAAAGTARIDASGSGASARYRLTFTPAPDFNGTARIGYTLANAFATSAPGTVEVQVQSRPDPSRDAEVSGLLAAQAAAARRFATAQIGNFQQRLENLHRGEGSGGFRNGLSFSADRRCQDQPRRLPGSDCAQQALNDEAAAQEASSATDGTGRSGDAGQIGVWTGGAINRGDRDATVASSGFDFETSGISAGADYRVNRAFAIGGGVGYGRDDSDVGHDGTRSEADSYSVALYASYHPGEVFFLDGLFGYQWLSYDLRRHVTANEGQVQGERDGTQWFGSISLGAELRRDRLQVAPYARWDVARGTLDGYVETGDDLYALRYADQDVDTSTGNLGLRIDYRIPTTFGSVAPQLRFEYQHDFQDDGSATISYADMLSGPFYRANVAGLEQNRLVFGLGAVLQTERDFSLRLEYRGLFQSNNDSDHGVLLNLEKKY